MAIGQVERPHGIHGALKIKLYNLESTALDQRDTIWVGLSHDSLTVYHIERVAPLNKAMLLSLTEIQSVEAADKLRQAQLWIETTSLAPLPEGEYYHYQLIGLKVLGPQAQVLGQVVGIADNAGADNLVIQGAKEYMIPLVSSFVEKIDIAAGVIHLRDVEGLL